ncbi:hypothetical protein MSC49_09770 [Methylosinus sp. C49]|nr:hypothetical protein MSC49_09770 [Methylosinus sp. C49]
MTAEAMLANIARLQRPEPARKPVARERQAERAGEHFRKECEYRRAPHGAGYGMGALGGKGGALSHMIVTS